MQWSLGRERITFTCGILLGLLLVVPEASAGRRKEHPYRHSVVDIPVSLAAGSVRTPEFSVPAHWYWIMVQVEKPLPSQQMTCMMGVTAGRLESKYCTGDDPLLLADWTVWDGDHVVDKGTIPNRGGGKFTAKYIFKFLGNFYAEAGKKYVLEVKFTKDGTPLNVANPHLIIVKEGEE
jgi:hypothetical protein